MTFKIFKCKHSISVFLFDTLYMYTRGQFDKLFFFLNLNSIYFLI